MPLVNVEQRLQKLKVVRPHLSDLGGVAMDEAIAWIEKLTTDLRNERAAHQKYRREIMCPHGIRVVQGTKCLCGRDVTLKGAT